MDSTTATIIISVALGISLAAASGFRVFVPFFILGIAARADLVHLSPGFDWMTSTPALVALAVATSLEIGAYYIPWVDNALDTLATPLAVIAGMLLSASVITELDPLLRWTLAIIVGGGAAGTVQLLTVLLRGTSTLTTGGVGNPVVSTAETAGAVGTSVLALFLPLLSLALLAALMVWTFFLLRKRAARRRESSH